MIPLKVKIFGDIQCGLNFESRYELKMITFLDYGAGNVRSLINAIESLGETVKIVSSGEDILSAEKLVFPGVGAFGNMMRILNRKNYVEPLKAYLNSNRPYLGICLGLQALFEGSQEATECGGLGLFPGRVKVRFRTSDGTGSISNNPRRCSTGCGVMKSSILCIPTMWCPRIRPSS
jgi:glutamine amidotransferase/cyclase